MSSLYDSEEEYNIHVARRHSPPTVRYVQSPPVRGAQYGGPSYLGPEQRNTVIARPHSRTRSPPRESPRDSRTALGAVAPPPPAPAPAPIIINNRIYNEHSSDEDSSDGGPRRSRRHVYRGSRSRSRSRSTSHSPPRSARLSREAWEAEQARRQLGELQLKDEREKDERRREKEYREEAELRYTQRQLEGIKKREADAEVEKRITKELEFKRLKEEGETAEEKRRRDKDREEMELRFTQRQLESIKKREADAEAEKRMIREHEFKRLKEEEEATEEKRRRDKEYRDEMELRHAQLQLHEIKKRETEAELEKRIKKELELKRLKEEEEAAEEKRRRDKEAHEAVERYKRAEADRMAHERKQKEQTDKEYRRRLHDDLLKSGLDENAIEAILSNKKVPYNVPHNAPALPALPPPEHPSERPTYTRMARKYLSIETLRTYSIEFEFDTNPEYVLIKRWVPEWEQDQFWQHTKVIREKRTKTLMVEERKHHHGDTTELEWVRKKHEKHDRKRSKSPALLMYLAGARPS